MTKAYGYRLQPTGKMATRSRPLDGQGQQLRDYCAAQGLTLVEIYTDEARHYKTPWLRRPLARQLREATLAGDHLVACHLDDFFASARDIDPTLALLDRWDVTVHLLDAGFTVGSPYWREQLQAIKAAARLGRQRSDTAWSRLAIRPVEPKLEAWYRQIGSEIHDLVCGGYTLPQIAAIFLARKVRHARTGQLVASSATLGKLLNRELHRRAEEYSAKSVDTD